MRCELCQTPLEGTQRRWCSKRCNDRSRFTLRTIPFTCPSCGARVMIFANKATRQKHCTRSCATATYNSKFKVGPGNPNWKGGPALAYGAYWKATKIKVRDSDKVCTNCGKTPQQNRRAL